MAYSNGYIVIKKEDGEIKKYLKDLDRIIIETEEVSVTVVLINKIIEANINMIFCNQKKNPSSYIIPIYGTNDSTKKVLEQINWNKKTSIDMWTEIVKIKIANQKDMLMHFGIKSTFPVEIKNGDTTNIEARYADYYFHKLFGKEFIRFRDDYVNSGLNYGYIVLLTEVTRVINKYGYLSQLGIHHCNKNNNYNLSCDLIEVFRPAVDMVVKMNEKSLLDKQYKQELINVLNLQVQYKEKRYNLSYVIELFFLDFIRSMREQKCYIEKVNLFG